MAWWERAYVGQKVVCVDDDWQGQWFPNQPVKGDERRILDMIVIEHLAVDGCPLFLSFGDSEAGYNASCFRPVYPKRTESGFETIRKILDTVPVKEDA